MANSADPDQLADLDLHCLQIHGISGFSRTRVKNSPLHTLTHSNKNMLCKLPCKTLTSITCIKKNGRLPGL